MRLNFIVKSARRVFLAVCGGCTILLLLSYLYLSEFPVNSSLKKLMPHRRAQLHPALFRNDTKPRVPGICSRGRSKDNTAILLVLSHSHNSGRRQVIRNGWGQLEVGRSLGMHALFVVEDNAVAKNPIYLESAMFGDIIHTHAGYPETEMVLNTLTALMWVAENCRPVKFVVMTEDNVFINVFTLRKLLDDIAKHENHSTLLTVSDPEDRTSLLDMEINRDLKFISSDPELGIQQHRSVNISTKKNSPKTEAATSGGRTLFCRVSHNLTIQESPFWVQNDKRLQSLMKMPHCSDMTFIAPLPAAKLLLDAYYKDFSKDVIRWPSSFYVTGQLANTAGLQHRDIAERYASGTENLDDLLGGETVFVGLSEPVTWSPFMWKLVIEREQELGNVNVIA